MRLRLRLRRLEAHADHPAAQRCIADIHETDALLGSVLRVFRGGQDDEPLQPTDVHALAQSLVDDPVEQGRPATLCGSSAVVPARPAALGRIVSSLLADALCYGGCARIAVESGGDAVTVVVDDDGPGIPPAELEAVFEPFYSVEASRSRHTGGSGLALYIARDVTERQHGSLALANRPGGGLRAEVRLPKHPAQRPLPDRRSRRLQPMRPGRAASHRARP